MIRTVWAAMNAAMPHPESITSVAWAVMKAVPAMAKTLLRKTIDARTRPGSSRSVSRSVAPFFPSLMRPRIRASDEARSAASLSEQKAEPATFAMTRRTRRIMRDGQGLRSGRAGAAATTL